MSFALSWQLPDAPAALEASANTHQQHVQQCAQSVCKQEAPACGGSGAADAAVNRAPASSQTASMEVGTQDVPILLSDSDDDVKPEQQVGWALSQAHVRLAPLFVQNQAARRRKHRPHRKSAHTQQAPAKSCTLGPGPCAVVDPVALVLPVAPSPTPRLSLMAGDGLRSPAPTQASPTLEQQQHKEQQREGTPALKPTGVCGPDGTPLLSKKRRPLPFRLVGRSTDAGASAPEHPVPQVANRAAGAVTFVPDVPAANADITATAAQNTAFTTTDSVVTAEKPSENKPAAQPADSAPLCMSAAQLRALSASAAVASVAIEAAAGEADPQLQLGPLPKQLLEALHTLKQALMQPNVRLLLAQEVSAAPISVQLVLSTAPVTPHCLSPSPSGGPAIGAPPSGPTALSEVCNKAQPGPIVVAMPDTLPTGTAASDREATMSDQDLPPTEEQEDAQLPLAADHPASCADAQKSAPKVEVGIPAVAESLPAEALSPATAQPEVAASEQVPSVHTTAVVTQVATPATVAAVRPGDLICSPAARSIHSVPRALVVAFAAIASCHPPASSPPVQLGDAQQACGRHDVDATMTTMPTTPTGSGAATGRTEQLPVALVTAQARQITPRRSRRTAALAARQRQHKHQHPEDMAEPATVPDYVDVVRLLARNEQ